MGYEYIGIDTSQELLKIARQTASATQFFYSTVYDMPFEKGTFDVFTFWAMLPHVSKDRIDKNCAQFIVLFS